MVYCCFLLCHYISVALDSIGNLCLEFLGKFRIIGNDSLCAVTSLCKFGIVVAEE